MTPQNKTKRRNERKHIMRAGILLPKTGASVGSADLHSRAPEFVFKEIRATCLQMASQK